MITLDMTGNGTIELRLDSDTKSIRLVRAVIHRLVDFDDDDDRQALLIAVSEVFANAVDEHVDLGIEEPIVVTLQFGQAGGITIVDRGRGLDDGAGSNVPDPDAAGGRGLPIVRALVPDVRISSAAPGTAIRLPWPAGCRPSADMFPTEDGER